MTFKPAAARQASETSKSAEPQDRPDVDLRVVPVRHYGRMLLSIIVVLVVLQLAYGLATNQYIHWDIVGQNLTSGSVLQGLGVTLQLTIISMSIGIIIATIIAIMRVSQSPIVRAVAWAYVFVFRGIPLIVILIFVGNIGLFVKEVVIGIPFTDIIFFSFNAQEVVTPFVASIIGLVLASSAYMSEIVRSGILSVNRGQHQAAKALGLNSMRVMRYVTLPQALRVIIPPMGNEFIGLLKASALVSVIAGGDLLTITQSIGGISYRVIEMLIVATFWYLVIISLFSVLQYFIERRNSER